MDASAHDVVRQLNRARDGKDLAEAKIAAYRWMDEHRTFAEKRPSNDPEAYVLHVGSVVQAEKITWPGRARLKLIEAFVSAQRTVDLVQ